MLQLGKSTGTKPPIVRAVGGSGPAVVPSGSYAPLPAMFPPFAFSGAAPANKVGPGGPHKETFTVVSTSARAVLLRKNHGLGID